VSGLILLVVLLALLVIAGLWIAGVYNGLVRLRNLVQEAWRQIDAELTRRHDLIPNLVKIVQEYASHERSTLDAVVTARAAVVAVGGSVPQQAVREGALSVALGRLFAAAQTYPELKADQNFLALQTELIDTEDGVAAGRRFYNSNVRELNTRVESFPAKVLAVVFHVDRAEYFELMDTAELEAVQASFGPGGSRPAESDHGVSAGSTRVGPVETP